MPTGDYQRLCSHLKGFLFHFKVSRPHHYSNQLYWILARQPGSAGRTRPLPCAKPLRYHSDTRTAGRTPALCKGPGRRTWGLAQLPHPQAGTGFPGAPALRFMSSSVPLPPRTVSCPTAAVCSGGSCPTANPACGKKGAGRSRQRGPDEPIRTCVINHQTITFTAGGIFPPAGKITA